MALSDYSAMALDTEGQPTSFEFVGNCGVRVEVSKTMVCLCTDQFHPNDSLCIAPILATVDRGSLTIGSLTLWVEELTAQRGRLVVANSGDRWFCGICVNGYRDLLIPALDYFGIERKKAPQYSVMESWNSDTQEEEVILYDQITETSQSVRFERNSYLGQRFAVPYEGVRGESFDELLIFLATFRDMGEDFDRWRSMIRKAKPRHYNQGDQFLLGGGEAVAQTDLDQRADAPLIMQMLQP